MIHSPITTGEEDLHIKLYAFEGDFNEEGDLIGKCLVQLSSLKDQFKKVEELQLTDQID